MHIDIIYEDKNVIAVNKPAGLLVHRTSKDEEDTLASWLVKHFPPLSRVGDDPAKRPGIMHRLDRDTSGVMLIAKNQDTFTYLKEQFQNRSIKKTYRALVYGKMSDTEGVVDKPISLKPGTVKRTVHGGKMTKDAVTKYKVIQTFKNFTLVEVMPKTGRTHQIRVHLASIDHPIVGDPLYGKKKNKIIIPNIARQMLHAYSIEFSLPKGKLIKIAADLPEDMENALTYLEGIDGKEVRI